MKKAAVPSILVAVVLLAVGVIVEAAAAEKVPRIGYLTANAASGESARHDGFQQGLRELGYIEGQNIATEYRYGDGKLDRFPGACRRAGPSQG